METGHFEAYRCPVLSNHGRNAYGAAGARAGLFLFVALATSCSPMPPRQTGFYCLDVPSGRPADVERVLGATASRLGFKVSPPQKTLDQQNRPLPQQRVSGVPLGVNHQLLANGKGVSLLVMRAMESSMPLDEFDNTNVIFNPKRYDVHAFKSGLWQRLDFAEVLNAFAAEARVAGMGWSKAPEGEACST